MTLSTYETTQPWICYHYGLTHDGWWPIWSSTRVLGVAKVEMECCICGRTRIAEMKIPRFGAVPEPPNGRHPQRQAFLNEHKHPDRGHPMSWARPLRNIAVFDSVGGMDLDLLGARLEADINDQDPA